MKNFILLIIFLMSTSGCFYRTAGIHSYTLSKSSPGNCHFSDDGKMLFVQYLDGSKKTIEVEFKNRQDVNSVNAIQIIPDYLHLSHINNRCNNEISKFNSPSKKMNYSSSEFNCVMIYNEQESFAFRLFATPAMIALDIVSMPINFLIFVSSGGGTPCFGDSMEKIDIWITK